MEYLVRLATAVGISAAMMVFSAEVRFCTWLLSTLLAAVKRFTLAPSVPRTLAMLPIAALICVSAACASLWLDRSVAARSTAPPPLPLVIAAELTPPITTEIVLDPIAVESLRKMLVAAEPVWVGLLRFPNTVSVLVGL